MDEETSSMDGEVSFVDVIHGWRTVIRRLRQWMKDMDGAFDCLGSQKAIYLANILIVTMTDAIRISSFIPSY